MSKVGINGGHKLFFYCFSEFFSKNILQNARLCDIIGKHAERRLHFAGVAQSVEQLIRNQQVAGSNPATSSNDPRMMGKAHHAGIAVSVQKGRSPQIRQSRI